MGFYMLKMLFSVQCKTWEPFNCRWKFVNIDLSKTANEASNNFPGWVFPLLFWPHTSYTSPTQLVKTACNWNCSVKTYRIYVNPKSNLVCRVHPIRSSCRNDWIRHGWTKYVFSGNVSFHHLASCLFGQTVTVASTNISWRHEGCVFICQFCWWQKFSS